MRTFSSALAAILFLLPACSNAEPQGELITALEQLAGRGNADATYHLAMAYHTGSGVERDPVKALAMFRKAAELGSELASYKLGCYYDGQGAGLVADDAALALKYKLVAAKAGYALAQQDVASFYARSGKMTEAVTWLEKAAAQGWPEALAAYASIHNGAAGISPDRAKTDAYFRLFLERESASPAQLEWLQEFEKKMDTGEKQRADEIVRNYRPEPKLITLTALSGQNAAIELVQRHH